MSVPRGLSAEEQTAWARLAESITPLAGRTPPSLPKAAANPKTAPVRPPPKPVAPKRPKSAPGLMRPAPPQPPRPAGRAFSSQLDSHWNRKLKAGQIAPDYTLDMHGHTLDSAYGRIISGLDQARAMDARLVLVIAGRERPVDPADRQHKRGAIRAKMLDWLAVSHHADSIAAVRRAHIRHGGEGALYLVLKRRR
ncbi:DNA mismatch repair protein MutS [Erythrobacter insulae]|uniref:DNA mismatch repair protein MutS n=1 Tax=Erythrobacter insulae TaxID=2584124 RepID=A0A547PC64_9SPHN|nr:Smr/MutS family protein [Erythrobacter insulae]TRD11732.1 DNA mismatch repair protein MutS [Erythrobacter insulae]